MILPAVYRPEGPYRLAKVDADILYLEPKWDGRWLRIIHDVAGYRGHGHNETATCAGFVPVSQAVVESARKGLALPLNTVVEGELLWPGHPAAEIVTAMKECPDYLIFQPFVVPVFNGEDLTRALYETARQAIWETLPFLPPFYAWAADAPPTWEEIGGIHRRLWPEAEGIVVKQYWYANWWKYKPVRHADLIVVGYTLGVGGKWRGLPNSMELHTAQGTPCGFCGNMPDEVRQDIPLHVGMVVEVAFDLVTKDGKLRFPRFVRWRDDKRPEDCKELSEQC